MYGILLYVQMNELEYQGNGVHGSGKFSTGRVRARNMCSEDGTGN